VAGSVKMIWHLISGGIRNRLASLDGSLRSSDDSPVMIHSMIRQF
jgi:hypothetical protein